MITRLMPLSALAAAALLSACQTAPVQTAVPPTSPEVVGEFRKGSGYLNGYIDRKELPDSLALVPPPPAPGSARQAADLQLHQQTRALRDTPRWTYAFKDVNLKRTVPFIVIVLIALGIAVFLSDWCPLALRTPLVFLTELLAAIDASQMTDDDKARLRDVIRVTDGCGTMREAREHAGLSVGQSAKMLGIDRGLLAAYEDRALPTPAEVRGRMMDLYEVDGFADDGPHPLDPEGTEE